MSSTVAAKQPAVRKARPYWHMDAKWIAGLLLIVTISATLALLALARVTNEQHGVKILTYAIAGFFSPRGLDDPGDIAALREKLKESPDHRFRPIEGLDLYITEADLAKSPRQLRLDLFGQMAGPLYRQDEAEIGKFTGGKSASETLGVAALLTRPVHDTIASWVIYPLAASLVLTLLLMYFSYGWGRLASPGWVLLVATLVPFLLTGAFVWGVIQWAEAPAPTGEGFGAANISYVASLLVPTVIGAIHPVYAQFFWIGLGLVGASLLGATIWRFVKKPAVVPVGL